MPAKVTLPVFMRLGEKGREQLVGHVSWNVVDGEGTTDLAYLEAAFPQMLDDSPELQALGIVREESPG